ncbi:unnamed protein product [Microthlaspi erraticum]|uniref:Uncharacterized protein n=1 Tax=Microthlaspi erraticum TaxID=1685480 RepID=A0A6D2KAY1_9BRAS|nr:unnamed protein product [Microthlaspi erraticum]
MAVKTDMSKAYDRLEWEFVVTVLERMGFHAKWINWILQCISTVSYTFLVNGAAQGFVNPQRGIRQRDPLSPFIFIICGEVLSGLCKDAQTNTSMPGLQVSRASPQLNHLLFADDTIKTPPDIKDRVKTTLGIDKEGGQGKYLGLPESFGRRKKDLFTAIVDRIRQKAVNFSSRFLSSVGKLTLIKSVLSAMPTYSMSCFKLPAGLCKRIQSAITRFWWDTKPGKKKMCWISWDRMAKSKKEGGLGFRDIQSFNDALLAKVSWRILNNPECLLARILKGKYCKYDDFLSVQVTSSTSHGWRGILIGRDLLNHQLGPPNLQDKDLLVSDLLLDQPRRWNKEKIENLLPHHLNDILLIRPSLTGARDSFIWIPTKSGDYSVKTGYHVALGTTDAPAQHNHSSINWNLEIWHGRFSPKMKVFLWKIMQEALPLGDNLLSRGLMDNACCVHCAELETTEHLFLQCAFAQRVWNQGPFKTALNPLIFPNFTSALIASKDWICLPPTGLGAGPLFPWICWSIWNSRNYLVFEERTFSPEETLSKVISEAKEWQLAQVKTQKGPITPNLPHLPHNSQNSIVCFTDGSWCKELKTGGMGWIFADTAGTELNHGQASERFVTSPLMAEALAIRSALNQALELGITNLHLKSDAQDLIRALNSQEQITEIFGILFDINTLASMFSSISFTFIPRSENMQADSIAKNAIRLISNLGLVPEIEFVTDICASSLLNYNRFYKGENLLDLIGRN